MSAAGEIDTLIFDAECCINHSAGTCGVHGPFDEFCFH